MFPKDGFVDHLRSAEMRYMFWTKSILKLWFKLLFWGPERRRFRLSFLWSSTLRTTGLNSGHKPTEHKGSCLWTIFQKNSFTCHECMIAKNDLAFWNRSHKIGCWLKGCSILQRTDTNLHTKFESKEEMWKIFREKFQSTTFVLKI